tara:strand:- start:966 stop:1229 length:264 start_codon:yes stop_codon:yes gene_type:complete
MEDETMFIFNWWNELSETDQEKWIYFFIDNIKPMQGTYIQNTTPMKESTIVFIKEQMRLNKVKNFEKKLKEFLNDPEFDEKFGYLRC